MASTIEPKAPSTVATPLIPRPKPLVGFQSLAPGVSMYTPPPGTPPPAANAPSTILFCSWMNAAPRHIDYFTRNYIALFPGTRIILVQIGTRQFLYQSETTRRKQVSTVVDTLLAIESEKEAGEERLVIHCISNGGAKRAYGVAGLYRHRTGRSIPAKAFIFDSAPGIPQFRRDMHALMFPARNLSLFFWLPVYLLTLVSVSAVYVLVNWMPRWVWPDLVWGPSRLFNDPTFVGTEMLRGYVYSKEDLSIDYKNVEDHAGVAEAHGYTVVKKLVEGAAHAQMWNGKSGEKDYWGWVVGIWEAGLRRR